MKHLLIALLLLAPFTTLAVNTHSLDFGTGADNQYASAAHNAAFNFGTGELTIEYWARLADTTLDATENVVRHYNSGGWVVQMKSTNRRLDFYYGPSGENVQINNAVPNDTDWHHYSFARSGSTATICIDGVEQTISSGTLSASSADKTTNLYLASNGVSEDFDGKMDEVRLWNVARSCATVAAQMSQELVGTETNLVGYWKLNNSGTDDSSNNNTLSLTNSPTYSIDVPFTALPTSENVIIFD